MTKQPKTVPNAEIPTGRGPNDLCVSVADMRAKPYEPVKTSGIKTRGNGAAQRGVTARGPMA